MVYNEDPRAQSIKEKEEANQKIAELEKALADEQARLAAETEGYPNLCKAAVEQFKESADFQIAIDAAVVRSMAREGDGGARPSGTTAGSRSEEEVIQSFQRSDFYKHEMAEFWDSGWKTFKRKVEELFPDLDFSQVKIDKDDVTQTSLDEGIEEEDLASSKDE
ncbi:hypothetical protein CsSME_00016084 [Camellia sinensis var. sinensis]